jgi:hypothetical protein
MTEIKNALPLDWLLAKDGEITQEELNEAAKMQKYQNREMMPESYLPLSDLYHELTGQELTKRVLQDWMRTFEEWKQEGLSEDDIRLAFAKSNDVNGGFFVGRPGALTTTALAMKTKSGKSPILKVNQKAIEGTKQMLDETYNQVFVPRPANVARPNIKGVKR